MLFVIFSQKIVLCDRYYDVAASTPAVGRGNLKTKNPPGRHIIHKNLNVTCDNLKHYSSETNNNIIICKRSYIVNKLDI